MKKVFLAMGLTLFLGMTLASCNKEEVSKSKKEENKEQEEEQTFDYKFNHDGIPSVFIGEAKEAIIAFKHLNNAINAKTITNIDGQRKKYDTSLKPLIVRSWSEDKRQAVHKVLDSMLDEMQEAAKSDKAQANAKPGEIGIFQVSNDEQRLVNGKGVELGQTIQKMLMGALQVYNIEHLLDQSLKSDNTKIIKKDGFAYTEMENHWDVARGYIGTLDADFSRIGPLFLANYIEKESVGMKGLEDINILVYQAFYKGRKAIVNKNIDEATKQRTEIKRLLANLMVKRTLYYLRESNKILGKSASPTPDYFHSMGEALGFILALPFVQNSQGEFMVTMEQAKELFDELTSGEIGIWNADKMKASAKNKGSISYAIDKIIGWTKID